MRERTTYGTYWIRLPHENVIEWFRGLAAPFRYALYVAIALVVFLAAVGMGATAALVVSRHPETRTGRASNSHGAPEGRTTLEKTAHGRGGLEGSEPEDAGAETTNAKKGSKPDRSSQAVSFVHRATDANSRGDYTYISAPSIDGDPDAIVLATPASGSGAADGNVYPHNIGVWYEPVARKWAIFDQDRAAVPAGTTFEVLVPRRTDAFVHHAASTNTVGGATYLDDPRTNGRPSAVLSVTQNWNPGGGRGVYNDHPIDVVYDEDVHEWAIYDKDGALMPEGAAFNVAVSAGEERGK
jgi:hypothetical protein